MYKVIEIFRDGVAIHAGLTSSFPSRWFHSTVHRWRNEGKSIETLEYKVVQTTDDLEEARRAVDDLGLSQRTKSPELVRKNKLKTHRIKYRRRCERDANFKAKEVARLNALRDRKPFTQTAPIIE